VTNAQLNPEHDPVVDTAGSGTEEPLRDVPGSSLLRFAGTMDPEVAREIAAAIEEDCERIEIDDDPGG
jgi:hypothetical protein